MSDLEDKPNPADKVYSESEVIAHLQSSLPHWYLEDGWIRRKYKTSGWKGTLMVVNTIGHLAEAAWHHPDLTVSYAFVIVKLCTHSAKGITDKDFELAHKIESVIQWQPSKENPSTSLEGTPNDDARFKYIKYD
jgi:4a-hydroxytetrahydrobiopterin dehydratase